MKITHLDKKIIEHIGEYMDKTLTEGIYIRKKEGRNAGLYHLKEIDDAIYRVIDCEIGTEREFVNIDKYIIGHYDITAVLKYMVNVSNFNYEGGLDINEIHIYNFETNNEDYYIPNKPLHLYSEQEKKDLLILLDKIKTGK